MIDTPIWCVVMLIWSALSALGSSLTGQTLLAYFMIVCSCWWMFRVWEDLRRVRAK